MSIWIKEQSGTRPISVWYTESPLLWASFARCPTGNPVRGEDWIWYVDNMGSRTGMVQWWEMRVCMYVVCGVCVLTGRWEGSEFGGRARHEALGHHCQASQGSDWQTVSWEVRSVLRLCTTGTSVIALLGFGKSILASRRASWRIWLTDFYTLLL